MARISTGKVRLHKEPMELAPALHGAADVVRPLVDARRLHLEVVAPDAPLRLGADPMRLEQVFTNLLTNAAKYTPEGGHVWVTAALEGGEAVVRVRDDGIGIAPELLPHIFDLFTQAEGAQGMAPGGLGLGLTLVRNLVTLHGGTVQVRSEGPGRGRGRNQDALAGAVTFHTTGESLDLGSSHCSLPALRLDADHVEPQPVFLDGAVDAAVSRAADGLASIL